MRLEKEKEFSAYRIVVETLEEHKFLRGLFIAPHDIEKGKCSGFSNDLDTDFHNLITAVKT